VQPKLQQQQQQQQQPQQEQPQQQPCSNFIMFSLMQKKHRGLQVNETCFVTTRADDVVEVQLMATLTFTTEVWGFWGPFHNTWQRLKRESGSGC